MAKPKTTTPAPLGQAVLVLSSGFSLLHNAGITPILAFVLAVVAACMLQR